MNYKTVLPTYTAIQIVEPSGELVVSIGADGTVKIGEGYSLDEASQIFWDRLGSFAKFSFNAGREYERNHEDT